MGGFSWAYKRKSCAASGMRRMWIRPEKRSAANERQRNDGSEVVVLLRRNKTLDAGQQVFLAHAIEGDIVLGQKVGFRRILGLGSDRRQVGLGLVHLHML